MEDYEKPMNIQSFKRSLNRRIEKAVAKKTRLEIVASVLNNRYNESDTNGNASSDQNNNHDNINLEVENENINILYDEDVNSEVDVENININNNSKTSNNTDSLDESPSSHNFNCDENNSDGEVEDLESDVELENIIDINDNSEASNSNSIDSSDEDQNSYDSNSNENDPSDNDNAEEEEHLQSANEYERGQYVIRILREWVKEEGIMSMRKLDSLLAKLHCVFPNIPLSYKTLLQIPYQIDIKQVNGGELWYKGIAFNLNLMNLEEYLQIYNEILIDINIDGLPLFKSSSERFWPILGKLVKSKNEPFIITMFKGKQDPVMDDLLYDFVIEVADLSRNGYRRDNISYRFSIRHYILDAPARSKVKCCIEHGGYCACEKCEVVGEYIDNRMTYVELGEILRTDQSFLNQEQPYHHTGRSRLEEIGVGLVSQFRLDALHLVYLGVFKRLILACKKWKGPWKLHRNTIKNISQKLLMLKDSCPRDFNRPPRTLADLPFFKATEFRRILLYDGILVFKDSMAQEVYKHFLLLHCGIYILSSPSLVQIYCDYANKLLRTFISYSIAIYGPKFVVYNVHSLSHLASECETHGKLDGFSAFQFENKLQSIKASLRSGYKPLKQAAFRDLEKGQINITLEDGENFVTLFKRRKECIVNEPT